MIYNRKIIKSSNWKKESNEWYTRVILFVWFNKDGLVNNYSAHLNFCKEKLDEYKDHSNTVNGNYYSFNSVEMLGKALKGYYDRCMKYGVNSEYKA